MQLDYLQAQQFQPRKIWWKERADQQQQKNIYTLLRQNPAIAGEEFVAMDITERDLFKHSLIIPTTISYNDFINGQIKKHQGYLFTYFRQGQQPYFADIKAN